MGAHIEWVTGVLRVGEHLHKWGDPFDLSCTVIRDNDTMTFLGASSSTISNLLAERDNIRALLLPLGIRKVKWIRLKNDRHKEVIVEL